MISPVKSSIRNPLLDSPSQKKIHVSGLGSVQVTVTPVKVLAPWCGELVDIDYMFCLLLLQYDNSIYNGLMD
jgi:hypothetical protein